MMLAIGRASLGVVILIALCYLLSSDKKAVNWKLVITGVLIQVVLAILMIKVPFVTSFFQGIVSLFLVIIDAATESSAFLFGELATESKYGFAFSALPTIVFFSALTSLFYYYGILQKVVYGFAWMMNKTMNLTGAESLAAAANVFMGQTEAPLVIKPYLEKMSRSEIMSLMTGGMATIAGSVFGFYMAVLGGGSDTIRAEFGLHLLVASIISAPAALVVAKILVPAQSDKDVSKDLNIPKGEVGSNVLDAIAQGTSDGVKLAVNVGAMLLAFMAIVFLCNNILGIIGDKVHLNDDILAWTDGKYEKLSLQLFLGYLFAPLSWVMGIQGQDIYYIGQLLGEKTILNEFVAYVTLGDMRSEGLISNRSAIMAAYALCGFANFASIGIQIGGIGALAPGKRVTLTELGFKALIGGTIATVLTGCLAGALI